MISDRNFVFVWAHLPGDAEPTLCGRYSVEAGPSGLVGAFVYGKSYLHNPDAVSIDPVGLPLVAKEFTTTAPQGVFGALHDAIPDDWGRYVISKTRGQQKFPIGVMLNTLDDAVGNLSFSESAQSPPALRVRPLPVEKLEKARAVILRLTDERPEDEDLDGLIPVNTAMGGARPKLTIESGGALWIAKFPSFNDRGTPVAKLEAASLMLAHLCDIDVPDAEVQFDNILLVKRFDRRKNSTKEGWSRDAFLSARTLCSSSSKPTNYGGSYARLAHELGRYSCQAAKDRAQLYRRMVFNVLLGNTDDHDRNHGILADDEPGSFRLSPAYDLIPQRHSTLKRYHAMALGLGESLATRDNLLGDVNSFGLSAADGNDILEDVALTISKNWQSCFEQTGVDSFALEELSKNIGVLHDSAKEIETLIASSRQAQR